MIGEAIAFKVAAMEGRLAKINEGTDAPTIEVYGGTRPATGAAASDGALCVISLTRPAGSVNATTGVLTLTQLEDGLNLATGIATWCRVKSGAGGFCFDMDAGVTGSGAEAIFATTQLYAGGGLRLLSCALG